jgi:O-antigen ligase
MFNFQSAFLRYFNEGEQFDSTMSGRTAKWQEGWELLQKSPLVGVGFQGDRIFLNGAHMHDGLLQALVQSGVLGAAFWIAALLFAWVLVFRLYHQPPPPGSVPLPADVPGILAFLTVGAIAESNFAYFSVAWMVGAPLLGYVQCVAWQRRPLHVPPAKAAGRTRPRFAPPQPAGSR